MFSDLIKRMRRRMSYYKPKRFSDHYEYAAFFNVRYNLYGGDDLMVLEYPSTDVQELMFKSTTEKFDLTNKTILDVGCGLGYLKKYLDAHAPGYHSYLGVDLSDKMVAGACQRFGDYFVRRDVLAKPFTENEFDFVFLISVLGYPVTKDPFGYMSTLLCELFRISRLGLGFTHLAPKQRQEPSDFTVPPEEMGEWCRKNLSPNVIVNYTPGRLTYYVNVSKSI